jgi:DNA-binding SARP family transcriptional activator
VDLTTIEPRVRVCLLGRFEVRVGDALVIDRSWNRSKAKALLKVLALQEGRALHREQVLDALWPDLDPTAASSNLRKNLHYLRSTFTTRGVAAAVVAVTADIVTLSDTVLIDVDDFRAAARAARASRTDAELYEAALRLYAGDSFPRTSTRIGPRRLARNSSGSVANASRSWRPSTRRPASATWRSIGCRRCSKPIPWTRRSIDRSCASTPWQPPPRLRQYERCRDILQKELNVEPASETEALRRQILAGRVRARAGSRDQAPECTAPGFLDSEQDSVVIVGASVARPSPPRDRDFGEYPDSRPPRKVVAVSLYGPRLGAPPQHGQAALGRVSARAWAGVRWPRRSMSHSVL